MKSLKAIKLSLVLAVILSMFSAFALNNVPVKAATTKTATVTVYGQKSSWSQIRYKGKKAYVVTKYLNFGVTVKKYKYKNISKLEYPMPS